MTKRTPKFKVGDRVKLTADAEHAVYRYSSGIGVPSIYGVGKVVRVKPERIAVRFQKSPGLTSWPPNWLRPA